jgi:hypothetical protein
MVGKKNKWALTLAGIVAATALSIKSKPADIRDKYYDNIGPRALLIKGYFGPQQLYYMDLLDDTQDTLKTRRRDYITLDSLMKEARKGLDLNIPLVYMSAHIDSVANSKIDSLANASMNRPMINDEVLVRAILDTVTGYTEVVDKYFILASIREESWYDSDAKSDAGAIGLGQFTEWTYKLYGDGKFLPDAYDPEKNIRATIRYSKTLEKMFSEELGTGHSRRQKKWDELTIGEKRERIAAAYNGGPDKFLKKAKGDMDRMPSQSIAHASKVARAMTELRREDLFRNIAMYRARIDRYEPAIENTFWLVYNAAHTEAFMNNYIYKTKSSS